MGIAGFSQSSFFSVLFAPLQIWLARFEPAAAAAKIDTRSPASISKAAWRRRGRPGYAASRAFNRTVNLSVTSRCAMAATAPTPPCALAISPKAPSRLKVVREFDATVSPKYAGRMMISGRMEDVCAELDRLARD